MDAIVSIATDAIGLALVAMAGVYAAATAIWVAVWGGNRVLSFFGR